MNSPGATPLLVNEGTFLAFQSCPRTACDWVVQHDRDMQQNSCRVELNGFSVELDDRGLKSCARVRRIIDAVPKSPGSWGQRGGVI